MCLSRQELQSNAKRLRVMRRGVLQNEICSRKKIFFLSVSYSTIAETVMCHISSPHLSLSSLIRHASTPEWESFHESITHYNGTTCCTFHRHDFNYSFELPSLSLLSSRPTFYFILTHLFSLSLSLSYHQVMLYVDGMNGVMKHSPTIQWLYTLIASKYRLVVKTALKLLLVFVEYCEGNCYLLVNAIRIVDTARGSLPWTNIMKWVSRT